METSTVEPSESDRVHRDMSPERDLPPAKCRFTYLICSTPRSGSWLLSTGLDATGCAGRPSEYFSPTYVKAYLDRIGLDADSMRRLDYMQFLRHRRTTSNGVFGMKMHFSHLSSVITRPSARREFLRRFDRLIFLTRRDKLAQAVSFWKTQLTQVYRVDAEQSATSAPLQEGYDFARIVDRLRMVVTQEADWAAMISQFQEKTYSLSYEELSSDYAGCLKRVLEFLGLFEAAESFDPRPQIAAQRDQTNVEWERRFMQELCGEDMRHAVAQFATPAHVRAK